MGRRRRRLAVLVMLALEGAMAANACELVLTEHRSGRMLVRLPLDPALPEIEIAFVHSVLGTTVRDRYVWRAGDAGSFAELVEERFEGEGYGLPHVAGPGESLTREGAGWRLQLRRKVDPLVVRPLAAQRMRVQLAGHAAVLLADLSDQSIHMQARDCPAPPQKKP